MTTQNAKKRETEVTLPRKSSVRRVKVKGPHRKKTTPKNIQEITPPTQEIKCTRQTIDVMNQEMITGIWTDSDVSPPRNTKNNDKPYSGKKDYRNESHHHKSREYERRSDSRKDSQDTSKVRKEEDSYTDKKKHKKSKSKGKNNTGYNSQNKQKWQDNCGWRSRE